MKILLATDGSDYSKAAVNSVAERPWPEDSEVKIISAMEIPCSVEIVRQKPRAEK
jgi:hypothetical protein